MNQPLLAMIALTAVTWTVITLVVLAATGNL